MSDASDPKAIRKRLNWSQEQMADYLGLNRSSVSRLEKKGAPKGSVRRLLDALADRPPAPAESDGERCAPTPEPAL